MLQATDSQVGRIEAEQTISICTDPEVTGGILINTGHPHLLRSPVIGYP